jgi:Outer membrane protein beta-barrel domain
MKEIFFGFVVALVPLIAGAQGVGFGIKGGVNFANQDVRDASTSSITSFHAGAYLNLDLSESFGITPEVLITGNGSKINDVKFNADYLAIPIMLRFKPISLISLEAGPQFSFLTKAKVEGIGDVKDQLKSNDFGLAFGAGLHLPMGLNGGIRYVLGFTNISDVSEESIKNRTLQIYVGWTLFGAK